MFRSSANRSGYLIPKQTYPTAIRILSGHFGEVEGGGSDLWHGLSLSSKSLTFLEAEISFCDVRMPLFIMVFSFVKFYGGDDYLIG